MEKLKGKILWFVGLSGSGKTTISKALSEKLITNNINVIILDGDTIREKINKKLGFSREDRIENIRLISEIAKKESNSENVVMVAAITPYKEMHKFLRESLDNYYEIFVKTPLYICENRDVKGLYKKARKGEISNFTGISDDFDDPESPNLIYETEDYSVECGVEYIINNIK
jgi:adenylylsulfate kinase